MNYKIYNFVPFYYRKWQRKTLFNYINIRKYNYNNKHVGIGNLGSYGLYLYGKLFWLWSNHWIFINSSTTSGWKWFRNQLTITGICKKKKKPSFQRIYKQYLSQCVGKHSMLRWPEKLFLRKEKKKEEGFTVLERTLDTFDKNTSIRQTKEPRVSNCIKNATETSIKRKTTTRTKTSNNDNRIFRFKHISQNQRDNGIMIERARMTYTIRGRGHHV